MQYLSILAGGLGALLVAFLINAGGAGSYAIFAVIGLLAGYLVHTGVLKGERAYWIMLGLLLLVLAVNIAAISLNRFIVVAPIVAIVAMIFAGLVKWFQNRGGNAAA